jgi:hypothetical protein
MIVAEASASWLQCSTISEIFKHLVFTPAIFTPASQKTHAIPYACANSSLNLAIALIVAV